METHSYHPPTTDPPAFSPPKFTALSQAEPLVLSDAERRQTFLRGLALIMTLTFSAGTVSFLALGLLVQDIAFLTIGLFGLVGTVLCLLAYYLSHKKAVLIGSWLVVTYTFIQVTLVLVIFGTNSGVPAAYFIVVILSLFLLPTAATIAGRGAAFL